MIYKPEAGLGHNPGDLILPAGENAPETVSELLASETVDEEIESWVENGEEIIGEDDEDDCPEPGSSTLWHVLRVQHFIDIQNISENVWY